MTQKENTMWEIGNQLELNNKQAMRDKITPTEIVYLTGYYIVLDTIGLTHMVVSVTNPNDVFILSE